jgi:hypothetical protein
MRELVLASCGGVTDARLALFGDLQRLDARLCKEITHDGLAALPCLQWANLRGCEQFKEEEEEEEEGEGEGEEEEGHGQGEEEEGDGEERGILRDERFELGAVGVCAYCWTPCLFNSAPCSREGVCSEVTCRAAEEEDGDGEAPFFCEECVAQRGCYVCRALECELCTEEQTQDFGGDFDNSCVGRTIAPCSACRRNVCGFVACFFVGNTCGGTCVECKRLLCNACGDLERLACDPCSDISAMNDDSAWKTNAVVCGYCRDVKRIECALGYVASCKTAKRRADARALAEHTRQVQRSQRDHKKRARYSYGPFF